MKQFRKDTKSIMVTGMGLSLGASMMSGMGADASVLSPLGRGLGVASKMTTFGMITRQLQDMNKKVKQK